MRKKVHSVCYLTAEGAAEKRRDGGRSVLAPETALALFLLWGILSAWRDMMYGDLCLLGGSAAGCLTILALQIGERSPQASRVVKIAIYVAGILTFLGSILFVAQGFLDTVDRFRSLWDLRFKTDLGRFAVGSGAALGSLIFWCLCAVLLAVFVLTLMKKRRIGMLLILAIAALLAGFVLGRSSMWMSVLWLLSGVVGMFIYAAAPKRQNGIRGAACLLALGAAFLIFFLITGGYGGSGRIAGWRADAVAWFEKLRYGEDTLPRGELKKAHRLLDKEEETLELTMEDPQEWYLRGFVGGSYEGTSWRELSADAYQGEYEGLLQWLEGEGFSPLAQFAIYDRLESVQDSQERGRVKVEVRNTGAYRKYLYLPSSAESWTGSAPKGKKDWQVRSGRFFGAKGYGFRAVKGAASVETVRLGAWIQEPSKEEEKTYLGAESVYRAFAETYYMDVDEGLRRLIEEMFFAERAKMELDDVTAQIRRILRQETRYMDAPPALPAGEDLVRWFLEEGKTGNAVHYASAAVMAYRTAGYAARYVEGYHYPEEQAQELAGDGGKKAVLTSKNAHAWTEVYIPGAGWLPVEVVPGMYTESYTDQIVEGTPAYKVSGDPGEDGPDVEEGIAGGKENRAKDTPPATLSYRDILSILLLILYICFILYLVLEIQRAVRRARRRRDPSDIAGYVKEMEALLLLAKVRGCYDRPLDLAAQVEEKIAGVSRQEYERAVGLIQKVRFGGKELLPYETHTLECFADKVASALYGQKNMWVRFKVRYWYVLV